LNRAARRYAISWVATARLAILHSNSGYTGVRGNPAGCANQCSKKFDKAVAVPFIALTASADGLTPGPVKNIRAIALSSMAGALCPRECPF
jgi:hypothetical protein